MNVLLVLLFLGSGCLLSALEPKFLLSLLFSVQRLLLDIRKRALAVYISVASKMYVNFRYRIQTVIF